MNEALGGMMMTRIYKEAPDEEKTGNRNKPSSTLILTFANSSNSVDIGTEISLGCFLWKSLIVLRRE